MSQANEIKLRLQQVYRFSNAGLSDVDETSDLSEALRIREVEYDEEGRVTKETEFSEDGEPGELFEREYDEKGNVILMRHFFEGELSETTTYKYDEAGLLAEEKLEYADGGAMITHYTYDGNKNVTEKRTTDSDGGLDTLETFRYEGAKLAEHCKYDADNSLRESRKFIYRENSDLLREEIHYDADSGIELRTVYPDDESGSVTYNQEGKVHTRQKIVYDEKKRISEMFVTSYNGNHHYKYGYDERDNLIEESRTVGGTLVFKALADYNEHNLIRLRSVTEMNSGLFTDMYLYKLAEP